MLKVVITFTRVISTETLTQVFHGGLEREAEHDSFLEQFTVITELWPKEVEPKVIDSEQSLTGTLCTEHDWIKTSSLEENSGTKTLQQKISYRIIYQDTTVLYVILLKTP